MTKKTATGPVLAAKCAPDEAYFKSIAGAGIEAVELYLRNDHLYLIPSLRQLCGSFDFQYAIHAPTNGYEPRRLAELAGAIGAKIAVFHDIYFESEWEIIHECFKGSPAKVCLENLSTIHEPIKFMRRYGFGSCLDLEHFQLECAGFFENEFIPHIKAASHIHCTAYSRGSELWHSHIHHDPVHGVRQLNTILKSGYSGMVVSEAQVKFQTVEEYRKLKTFFDGWMEGQKHLPGGV